MRTPSQLTFPITCILVLQLVPPHKVGGSTPEQLVSTFSKQLDRTQQQQGVVADNVVSGIRIISSLVLVALAARVLDCLQRGM